jgi:serine phosphatase RsbU (regulator of sigma subunit)
MVKRKLSLPITMKKNEIIPQRFQEEYRHELQYLFTQRIDLFCYIVICAFLVELSMALILFRTAFSQGDLSSIAGGVGFAVLLLFTKKFTKPLLAEKARGMIFSFILLLLASLAAAAHPEVVSNLGISLVLIALFSSILLMPWNAGETALLGAFALGNFMWVYRMASSIVNEDIFNINVILLFVSALVCIVVKQPETVMREKDFSMKKYIEEKNTLMLRELELARKVHSGLIPKSLSTDEMDVAVLYKPMLYMGGDYAKFYFLDKDRLFFIIADVTGHGVSAALLVNRLHTEIEELVRTKISPGEVLQKLDAFIEEDFGKMGIFLSAFCGTVDLNNNELVYSNYGHPPQILFQKSDKKVIFMESQTFLMGVGKENADIHQMKIGFKRGDRVVLFTDGVVEAKNARGEEFGYDRLQKFITDASDLSVDRLNEDLLNTLQEFQSKDQEDDIFILSIQIKEAKPSRQTSKSSK